MMINAGGSFVGRGCEFCGLLGPGHWQRPTPLKSRAITLTAHKSAGAAAWKSACYNLRHVPPMQLSPTEQLLPQRPQFCESLMNSPMLTHLPMHISKPAIQAQKPPVHVSETEH